MRRTTLALALPGAGSVLLLALLAAEFPLSARAHQSVLAGSGGPPIWWPVPFGVVGSVLAWRVPRNRLGWILLGLALSSALSEVASFYVVARYRLHQPLPFGWVALLAQPSWSVAIILIGLLVLLFPDGHLPSPRLRWLLWTYLTMAVAWMAGAYGFTVSAIVRHDVHTDPSGNLLALSHPTGAAAWWNVVQTVLFVILAASGVVSLAGQAASYRRSSGERRQQLKWLLGGSIVAVLGLVLAASLPAAGLAGLVGGAGIVVAVFALPVSMAVAVLKYRLYDIDRLISRTVAYAIVTGLLVGVYVGLVLAAEAIGSRAPVRVALATLAAAALFSPLRRRVQRAVDRQFNRARYDADKTVAAFAARLQDQVELDAVRADLTDVVQTVLEPTQVGIWIAR
jgi:hypothetical protein